YQPAHPLRHGLELRVEDALTRLRSAVRRVVDLHALPPRSLPGPAGSAVLPGHARRGRKCPTAENRRAAGGPGGCGRPFTAVPPGRPLSLCLGGTTPDPAPARGDTRSRWLSAGDLSVAARGRGELR